MRCVRISSDDDRQRLSNGKSKAKVNGLKAELAQELARPLMRHGISAKYITAGVGGQANFADSMLNQTSELSSLRRRSSLIQSQAMRNLSAQVKATHTAMPSPDVRSRRRSKRLQRRTRKTCQLICKCLYTNSVAMTMHRYICSQRGNSEQYSTVCKYTCYTLRCPIIPFCLAISRTLKLLGPTL